MAKTITKKQCPGCDKRFKISFKQSMGNMSPQALAGLCKKFGQDEGFFTRCAASNIDVEDKNAFCAALHKACIGKWPAEKKELEEDNDLPTITIDTVENDDWMKTLPGYKNERAIHEQLAKKYRGKKVGNKLIVSKLKE